MKKFIILITLITISHLGFTQMTTIYECGINTPDSVVPEFNYIWSKGMYAHDQSTFPDSPKTFINKTNSFEITFKYSSKAALLLYKSIPFMSDYGYVEYYIDYTISDPNSELGLYSRNNTNQIMIGGSSSVGNIYFEPDSLFQLIGQSPLNMATIPFNNNNADSVLGIFVNVPYVDSVNIKINYIRVDVDLSSYMMFATDVKEQTAIDEFSLFASNKNINISTSSNNPYQVNVFNINGQEIYQGSKNGNSTIPLETNSNGIYLVRIVDSQGKVISKKVYLN